MKLRVLLRKVHHWGSIVIAVPLLVMIGAGLLLMLKKEVSWIQPPTEHGISSEIPILSFEELFAAAQGVEEAGLGRWSDLARVDVKPDKGVIKFVGENRWEVQVDTATADVLQVAYRRSDLIESIHDGSFFAGWSKLYLFLPAGIVLLLLWGTGLYLFFLPHVKNYQKRRTKRQFVARNEDSEKN
ncbi:MAG: PepSY-associated TM helix domain-containing protein [Hyphomonadaceae bacterium]